MWPDYLKLSRGQEGYRICGRMGGWIFVNTTFGQITKWWNKRWHTFLYCLFFSLPHTKMTSTKWNIFPWMSNNGTYLTENRDVIHMIIICQWSHESVAETRLPDAHGPLLLLPPGQPHHGHRYQLAGPAHHGGVSSSQGQTSWKWINFSFMSSWGVAMHVKYILA